MAPSNPLPYNSREFSSAEEYVSSLLKFSSGSVIFQKLCGGVHILDFFTTHDSSLFHTVIPREWQEWLLSRDSMELLDFLIRDDLKAEEQVNNLHRHNFCTDVPETLINYVREIRKYNLCRDLSEKRKNEVDQVRLPRRNAVGMIPKKIHEVGHFARYVTQVSQDISNNSGKEITHFLDLGSGQNYLGRTLANTPYNKQVIAVENKELNINGAKNMDVLASFAKRETVMRNKKLYRQQQVKSKPLESLSLKERRRIIESHPENKSSSILADLRPSRELDTIYTPRQNGKGHIYYVHHQIENGDLTNIFSHIEPFKLVPTIMKSNQITESSKHELHLEEGTNGNMTNKSKDIHIMTISIHSCGNLSHHGIRSLLLNQNVQAISIVGCCYNLLSERFGYPSLKHPLLRPNLQAINDSRGEVGAADPHGFPMSERIAKYDGNGLGLNITSRMMAVQAPSNWTEKESDLFFTRHFFRALLQRIFLDWGVVKLINGDFRGILECTEPIIIGTLRKRCYVSFRAYTRGAIEKLSQSSEHGARIMEKLNLLTDDQIDEYMIKYEPLKKHLSITWSLMAFSAGVVESLILVDRWLFLKEHPDIVQECWVEPVFDYHLSPRNLVLVGIKR